jgi:hypothetical protein
MCWNGQGTRVVFLLFALKWWKTKFFQGTHFQRLPTLIIDIAHSFQLFFWNVFVAHDSYACLLSITNFLYTKWSTTSWFGLSLPKTCKFRKLTWNYKLQTFILAWVYQRLANLENEVEITNSKPSSLLESTKDLQI